MPLFRSFSSVTTLLLLAGMSLAFAPRSAVAAPSSRGSQAASARSLMVTPTDAAQSYGGTFTVIARVAVPNTVMGKSAALTGLKVSDYVRAGRINGYAVILSGGKDQIVNSLDVYKAGSGPRWQLRYSVTHHSKLKGFTAPKQHVSSLSGLGDQAFAVTSVVKTPNSKKPTNVLSIVFVQGRYLGSVTIEESSVPSLSAAKKLASAMDRHIQQKG